MIQYLKDVWPLVTHAGSGAALIAAFGAAAWFSPVFKKELAFAAAAVAIVLGAYAVGVHDEKVLRDAREQVVQQNVDTAVRDAVTSKQKDRFDDPSN